jgi:hypothetical protein
MRFEVFTAVNKSSGQQRGVDFRQIDANVSEKHTASIFRAELF